MAVPPRHALAHEHVAHLGEPVALVVATTAALARDAAVHSRDTPRAGENATCVDVAGVANGPVPAFTTCVTVGGVLGSFQATVDGHPVDATLDRYDERVPADAFATGPAS